MRSFSRTAAAAAEEEGFHYLWNNRRVTKIIASI